MLLMLAFGTTACSLVGKKNLSLSDSEEFVNGNMNHSCGDVEGR